MTAGADVGLNYQYVNKMTAVTNSKCGNNVAVGFSSWQLCFLTLILREPGFVL